MCDNNQFNKTIIINGQGSVADVKTSKGNEIIKLFMPKERTVIPIIFIPGIMGSNLQKISTSQNKEKIWRLDSEKSAAWYLLYGSVKRHKILNPDTTEVDKRGKVVERIDDMLKNVDAKYSKKIKFLQKDIKDQKNYPLTIVTEFSPDRVVAVNYDPQKELNDLKTRIEKEKLKIVDAHPEYKLFGARRERGWGTVSYYSYGEFLESFQSMLLDMTNITDRDPIKNIPYSFLCGRYAGILSKTIARDHIANDDIYEFLQKFHFPVHAMGYNWLKSNAKSAEELGILVKNLHNHYEDKGYICGKPILVTHSMGGLVARYYTQYLGGEDKVLGVIHGVMPTNGAACAYTRLKRGTESSITVIKEFITVPLMNEVLGKNAAEITAVFAQSPGAMQLLPNRKYGNHWLKIIEKNNEKSVSYPEFDPYKEIYLAKNKWWVACEPHLINPSYKLQYDSSLMQMERDWSKYSQIIEYEVKTFHDRIIDRYHNNTYSFFGASRSATNVEMQYSTYNTVHWKAHYDTNLTLYNPRHNGDQCRYNLNEIGDTRTIKICPSNYGKIKCRVYVLQPADEPGDGTVPVSSAKIPDKYVKIQVSLPIVHNEAYNNKSAQEFTEWSIVDILLNKYFN